MSWGYGWRPYVPVALRRARAAKYAAKLAKKQKRALCPVQVTGRQIAQSFWGRAWCENLEQYSDYENRLPRGRTYLRNGSVIDLQIETGKIKAIVSGSEPYRVAVSIRTLPKATWTRVKQDCMQGIDSLIDLLQGRFDQGVMKRLTQPKDGLFPRPAEIEMDCSCPDWAGVCKHIAAVLYGVAALLDTDPKLLFTLRGVDHLELIAQAVAPENLERSLGAGSDNGLADSNLSELFGIEIERARPEGRSVTQRSSTGRTTKAAASPHSKDKPTAKARTNKVKPVFDDAGITRSAHPAPARKPPKRKSASSAAPERRRKASRPA